MFSVLRDVSNIHLFISKRRVYNGGVLCTTLEKLELVLLISEHRNDYDGAVKIYNQIVNLRALINFRHGDIREIH